jgi:hypothetical protein
VADTLRTIDRSIMVIYDLFIHIHSISIGKNINNNNVYIYPVRVPFICHTC